MSNGIRRLNGKDRLLLSFSKDDLIHCATYTAQKTSEWAAEGKYPRAWTRDELIDAYAQAARVQYSNLQEVPPLVWDLNRPQLPVLDRGQHWRAALMQLFAEDLDATIVYSVKVRCHPSPSAARLQGTSVERVGTADGDTALASVPLPRKNKDKL
ncbi:hypothetical protein ABEF92_002165 [Exophiala dermatitidis]|uniref:Uncharacterized protein n=2 Tax=Exophiala dermatitidis TaxID=5970 RepID=H6BYP0_EXODN|nr:uncharacterized protein HMPREF1120_04820 [Exophiala dermatitidis NIH/UT8656]EHY56753.1 hypothetical protein HMPREF1120_04820 [Exophiala dermatitidis NIH/UT8656]KAJ4520196.1 hypothetical protein HRR75_002059 [Exophiala dermatitidis]KAJ4556434.1 hypothetical protein HRR78_002095 [Exophiala dermatitidis]